MKKGIIVSFEGIDGCGKTTQAKLFFERIRQTGIDAVLLNEPGGTEAGDKIRSLLLDKKQILCSWAELFLYLASRSQLLEEKVQPLLQNNVVVVLDRYIDSTTAYQGYGRGLPIDLIETIHENFTAGMRPALTFLIDDSPENLLGVLENKDRDRIEQESIEFQRKVRNGYLAIAAREHMRIKLIRRMSSLDTHKSIIRTWDNFYNGYKRG